MILLWCFPFSLDENCQIADNQTVQFFYNAYIYLHAILTTSSFITMSLTQLYTGVLYIFTITQYQVSVLRKINCIFKQEL